jgi:hypothetical protein
MNRSQTGWNQSAYFKKSFRFVSTFWFQVSGVSPAAGLKSGQFNRKKNLGLALT